MLRADGSTDVPGATGATPSVSVFDVAGPSPTARGTVSTPAAKVAKFRRSWPQRFVIVVGIGLIIACLMGASYISDIKETFGDIPRVAVSPGVLADVGDVRFDPRNILVMGWTDSTDIASGDDLLLGRGSEKLTDSMMLVRLDPTAATAAVLSIPRDLSFDGYNKINSAVAVGGPENAVKKVSQGLDVEIHDFVLINFAGFRRIIDSVDGVPVYFPNPSRDLGSFFDAPAGCSILDGEQALNYVRSRKFEQLINGRWQNDNKNDYGRAERQRDFLILAMDRVIAKGGRNPTTMKNLLKTTVDTKSVLLDEKLTPQDLLDIGRAFANFKPEELQRYSLPTYADPSGSGNLLLNDDAAVPVLDVFRGNTPDLQPFQVGLSVYDGRSDTTGANPATQLHGLGFNSGNALKAPDGPQAQTVLRFTSDERYAALAVASRLAKLPALQQVKGSKATLPRGTTLSLTVGADWAGVRTTPISPAETATLNSLIDEAAAGRVSAPPAPGAPTAGNGPAEPATGPTSADVVDTSGIIGRPPAGVSCTRIGK